MSVEENLRVIDANTEAVNARDWDRFKEAYAESAVFHGPESPEPLKGPAANLERLRALTNAFPDSHSEKVRAFGQGDWVVAEFEITGTHEGPLPRPGGEPIPATNKPISLWIANVYKFEGGKITEVRQYYDVLGMMAQLGLAP